MSLYPRSRQKSCVACAEGKRRCDRRNPQCSRCFNAKLQCVYIHRSFTQQGRDALDSQLTASGFSGNHSDENHISPGIELSLLDRLDTDPCLTINPSFVTFPSLVPDTSYPDIAFLDRWSVNQLVRSIKSYPQEFAHCQQTLFIHPRLYEACLPDAIQDAFAVSAAYSAKRTENEEILCRILESKTAQLAQQQFESRPVEELLAALQALVLLHIIQIFDGDIRQRSIAEQHFYTLESWTLQLRIRAIELGPALTWQEWIFAESVRRTVIVSTMLGGLYSVLKYGYCTNVPTLSVLPFTSATALWHASTNTAWLTESHQGESNTVLYGDYSKAWRNGQVSECLDSFHKLLLSPCMGEEYRHMLELED